MKEIQNEKWRIKRQRAIRYTLYAIPLGLFALTAFTITPFLDKSNVWASSADSFTFCDIFPCPGPLNPDQGSSEDTVNNTVEEYVRFGLSITFTLIMIYGIFLVVKAAFTIIRAEANADKVQEGFAGIKAVMIGFAVIFIGLIGLVVVVALFNGSGIFSPNVEPPDPGSNLPFVD